MSMLEMRKTINAAEQVMLDAEANAERMAEILIPRLHSVSLYELKRMKKILNKFNAHTGKWSN